MIVHKRGHLINSQQKQRMPKEKEVHPEFPMLPIVGVKPFHASYSITRFSDDESAKALADITSRNLSNGWMTDIYSLTRQDIPVAYNPTLSSCVQPITNYIMNVMSMLYDSDIEMADQHQPHLLKYSSNEKHTGVRIHRDRCDITANLMMSRSTDYKGGGTYFPALGLTIKLEYGELMLHPGSILHSGADITEGSRYLFLVFANKAFN